MDMQNKVNIYFGIIIIMLAFTFIAVGLIFVFIRYQKKILSKQQELHRLDAQHKKELLSSSIQSAESERMRIAKDIHDEIGSIFSTLLLSMNQFKQDNTFQPEQFQVSKNLIQSGINSVRRISHAIVPFELELLGLQQTLENYFKSISSISEMEINFENDYNFELLNNDASLAIYRIIQELTSNCIKHAGAKKLQVSIKNNLDINAITIRYQDDGIGIDPENQNLKKGIGLKNIESRAISFDGSSTFISKQGEGFVSEIIIPLNKNTTVC